MKRVRFKMNCKKILSVVVTMMLIIQLIPFSQMTAAAETMDNYAGAAGDSFIKKSDANHSNMEINLPVDSKYNGRIWTAKEVTDTNFKYQDSDGQILGKELYADADNFLVSLEAEAQAAEITTTTVERTEKTVNVCLVFDLSNSMSNNVTDEDGNTMTRLELLKRVANEFMTTLESIAENEDANATVNVSIVSYGSYGQIELPWTNVTSSSVSTVKNTINGLSTLGATNTQAGIWCAEYMYGLTNVSTNTNTHPTNVSLNLDHDTTHTLNYTLFMADGSSNVYNTGIDNVKTSSSGWGSSLTFTRNSQTNKYRLYYGGRYSSSNGGYSSGTGSYSFHNDAAKAAITEMQKLYTKSKENLCGEECANADKNKAMTVFSLGLGDAFVPEESMLDSSANTYATYLTYMHFMKLNAAIGNGSCNYTSGQTDYTNVNSLIKNSIQSEDASVSVDSYGIKTLEINDKNYADNIDNYYAGNTVEAFSKSVKAIGDVIMTEAKKVIGSVTFVGTEGLHLGGNLDFIDQIGKYMKVDKIVGLRFNNVNYLGNKFALAMISGTKLDPSLSFDYDEFQAAVYSRIPNLEQNDEHGSYLEELINTSIAGGALYYNSDDDFSNVLKWYADANYNFISPYYDADGNPVSVPANAKSVVDSYFVCHSFEKGLTVAASNLVFCTSAVVTDVSSGQQTVRFSVPSGCLPIQTIAQDENGHGYIKQAARPIGLHYKVSLNPDTYLSAFNDEQYCAENYDETNKTMSYYTNSWTREGKVGDGSTYVTFTPSTENPFYSTQKDCLLYTKQGETYTPATGSYDPSETYYVCEEENYDVNGVYRNTYFAANLNHTLSNDSTRTIADVFVKNIDGKLYEIKGAPRTSHISIDTHAKESWANKTNTYDKYLDSKGFTVSQTSDGSYVNTINNILGNNGKVTVPVTDVTFTKEWSDSNESHKNDTVTALVKSYPYYKSKISLNTPFILTEKNDYGFTFTESELQDMEYVSDILSKYDFSVKMGECVGSWDNTSGYTLSGETLTRKDETTYSSVLLSVYDVNNNLIASNVELNDDNAWTQSVSGLTSECKIVETNRYLTNEDLKSFVCTANRVGEDKLKNTVTVKANSSIIDKIGAKALIWLEANSKNGGIVKGESNAQKTITLNSENNWTYVAKNIPVATSTALKMTEYEVEEKTAVNGDGYSILNNYKTSYASDGSAANSGETYVIIKNNYEPSLLNGNVTYYTEFTYGEPWCMTVSALPKLNKKTLVSSDDSRIENYGAYVLKAEAGENNITSVSQMLTKGKKADVILRAFADNYATGSLAQFKGLKWMTLDFNNLYTYEMTDDIYIMFYYVTDGEIYYSNIKNRKVQGILEDAVNEGKLYQYSEAKGEVCQAMLDMTVATSQYNPTREITQYPDGTPLSEAVKSQYDEAKIIEGKFTTSLRSIEPWGLKLEAEFENLPNEAKIESGGVILLHDKDCDYCDVEGHLGIMTVEKLLNAPNTKVYPGEISNNTVTAYFADGEVYTYQLNTYTYTMFYVTDQDGNYYFSSLKQRNMYEIAKEMSKTCTDVKAKAVFEAQYKLFEAVDKYERHEQSYFG